MKSKASRQISFLPAEAEKVKGRPKKGLLVGSRTMIYQEKTPAAADATAEQLPYPRSRPASPREPNHRPVKDLARGEPAPPLLDKVRNFTNAAQVRAAGLYPYFRTISSAQDTEVLIAGKRVLMLGSNSYLGLTNHAKIKEAARAAVEKYGTGCAGSRFLNGTLDIHLELEAALGRLVNKEAVLLYSTGFQVNLGVISALVGKGDYVIGDKSNHASIVEGCLLSPGKFLRFAHRDMAALENRLGQLDPEAGKLIVVDGVFSMEGDIIQLPELCRIAGRHRAVVMVDDAHAIGVLGQNGSGTANHFGLTEDVHLVMGTFSKSLASLGGFIASDLATIDYLKHHSRPLIFSASMSPANAAAVLAALQIMTSEPERIAQLWRNTERMKTGLQRLGFDLGDSQTPILPVYCRSLLGAFKLCKRLQEEGIFVNPVVSPAVAPGQELIRISLMATHTEKQIDFALDKLAKVGKELGLI
jgi:8-amino-7-oxononanoate synthase